MSASTLERIHCYWIKPQHRRNDKGPSQFPEAGSIPQNATALADIEPSFARRQRILFSARYDSFPRSTRIK